MEAVHGRDLGVRLAGIAWHDGEVKAEACCLSHASLQTRDTSQITSESDLSQGHDSRREVGVENSRGCRHCDRQIGRRVRHPGPTHRRDVDIPVAQWHACLAFQDGQNHGDPAALDPMGGAPRVLLGC